MKAIVAALAVASGLLTLVASTPAHTGSIVVPRDFPTIQAAVDAASPGDTITIKSGIYTEELVISKDVRLIGAGVGATIIKSPTALTTFAVDVVHGTTFTAIVRIAQGAHARISDLTVSGPIPCAFVFGIVVVQSSNLELTDARVTNLVPDPTTCSDAAARSVQFGLGDHVRIDGEFGTTASGRVTGVLVDNFQTEGLVANGPFGVPPTSVTFTNNVIVPGIPALPTAHAGIDVFLNAVADVKGNTIVGGVCTFPFCGPDVINDVQAIGIFVGPGSDGSRISDNRVSDTDIGIGQLASTNCTIRKNNLKDNRFYGIVIADTDGTTHDNTITGGQVGIGVVAISVDTVGVLRGDKIKDTSVQPVEEVDCCGVTATAIVKPH
jgi:parallel beta-helix repeat protein